MRRRVKFDELHPLAEYMPGIFRSRRPASPGRCPDTVPGSPGIPGRQDHAVHTPVAKAARDENPIAAAEAAPGYLAVSCSESIHSLSTMASFSVPP